MRESGTRIGGRYELVVVAVFGALGLVVMGLGAFALVAEVVNTWTYYFMLERAIALATPVTTVLAVAAFLVVVGAVARA